MATILSGDIQVDFLADARQKRLSWIGGATTRTMNDVYSAMATLLDETTTIDDGTCFSAETPTEYTIGQIDTGDTEPWYITFDCMEHITGGALRSTGWERSPDTNTGIIIVPVTAAGSTIAASDEGDTLFHGDGDTGTLLEYIDSGGTNDYCVIRPTDSTSSNDFDSGASGTITMDTSSNSASQAGNGTTGDMIWANLYSLGTIDPNVHLYAYQGAVANDGDRSRLTSWNDATQDWYGNGHIDTTFVLKDITSATWGIIDAGYITMLGRKSGDLYASFEVLCSTTSGGRNPIPLQTAADLDQITGIKRVTTGVFSGGPFIVGEIISEATSGARGIVTSQITDTSIDFMPIDDPQVDFFSSGAQTITGADSDATATSSGESDQGPAIAGWFTSGVIPTIGFTHDIEDIDDDETDENYAITIDCQQNPLTEVYEWCKYATRNGEITNSLDGINGELYEGASVFIAFSSENIAIGEGEDVVQQTTDATGVVIAYDSTAQVMLLRNTRGTFATGAAGSHTISSNDSSGNVEVDAGAGVSVSTFAPKTASPLGTFAGGTFFGARGVLLSNYLPADANSFILTPMEGGTKEVPASVSITVTGLAGGAASSNVNDKVAVFRLTGDGGDIDKSEYTCVGGEAVGANTITTDTISQDTPGKTSGGTLVLVDADDGGREYKLRYLTWSGSVFNLNEITGTADGLTDDDTLINSLATFTDGADKVYRGDLVTVSGKGSAHVLTVDNDTTLTLEAPGISGMTATDNYEINTSPIAITSSDNVYVPFMDRVALSGTETASFIYNNQVFYRAKVRNTRATIKIKPFSVDGSTTGGDIAVATIRTPDTIITTS